MAASRPVALVTGASSGIGKVAALALVDAGYDVVGTSRNPGTDLVRDGVAFIDLDVTSDDSVATAIERITRTHGRLDVVVNNAGVGASGAAEENSLAQARNLFETNVFGVIRVTRAVLPHMRRQGSGRIINVSSIFGLIPAPFMAVYSASKHAIEGYSESVDHEVREHGIRVLLVEPAGTRTGFDDNTAPPDSPLDVYAQRRRIAGRVVADAVNEGDAPELVAKAIVAAATDSAPKLRYPASSTARRLGTLRRIAPAKTFDRQLRKFNKLAG